VKELTEFLCFLVLEVLTVGNIDDVSGSIAFLIQIIIILIVKMSVI